MKPFGGTLGGPPARWSRPCCCRTTLAPATARWGVLCRRLQSVLGFRPALAEARLEKVVKKVGKVLPVSPIEPVAHSNELLARVRSADDGPDVVILPGPLAFLLLPSEQSALSRGQRFRVAEAAWCLAGPACRPEGHRGSASVSCHCRKDRAYCAQDSSASPLCESTWTDKLPRADLSRQRPSFPFSAITNQTLGGLPNLGVAEALLITSVGISPTSRLVAGNLSAEPRGESTSVKRRSRPKARRLAPLVTRLNGSELPGSDLPERRVWRTYGYPHQPGVVAASYDLTVRAIEPTPRQGGTSIAHSLGYSVEFLWVMEMKADRGLVDPTRYTIR